MGGGEGLNIFIIHLNYYTEATSGFGGVVTGLTFTATATGGVFNASATWEGGIIPYGFCTVITPVKSIVFIAGKALPVPVAVTQVSGKLVLNIEC